MKIETQTTPERIRLSELVRSISVGMLSTIEDSGMIVSRPMAPLEMADDGAFWFYTNLQSTKVKQLGALNLSFADSASGTYVSISGHGEIHTDRTRMKRLWTSAVRPWFPEGADSPDLCLLKVVPVIAEYWDAPHSKMIRLIALASSIIAGEPVGIGKHDKLQHLATG